MDKEVDLFGWTKSGAKAMKIDCLTALPTTWEEKTVLMQRMLAQAAQQVRDKIQYIAIG